MHADPTSAAAAASSGPAAGGVLVKQLRQVLLWPLRLMPVDDGQGRHPRPWRLFDEMGDASPWRREVDEYTSDRGFHERHYNEFVSFLPYVQRFLYGEGRPRKDAPTSRTTESPMRVYRRDDVAQLRVVTRPGDAPITLDVIHVDLYFFFDVDVVLLNVELGGTGLTLEQTQELLYRSGRAFPAGWDADGRPLHCMASVQWLGRNGEVLAESDAHERESFLKHVAEHRAPRFSSHWAFLLEPLVSDHSEHEGRLRYRQIEYYRMPLMGYLSVDDPTTLTRADFVRLGLVTGAGSDMSPLPYSEGYLADFEKRYCYDRFWSAGGAAPHTRYLCNGQALIVIGDARADFYGCRDRGVLAQFRHQHFLMFLIAHFQKASLLMFSDRLVEALKDLDVTDADSVKRFKREIRGSFESFLRFTHRYWFHEISEQAHVRALWHLCATHLDIEPLYREVKERMNDMNSYLDTDSLRRQANTVVRLTVVTLFGLIGTVTTGFLGMNLLAEAEQPLPRRLLFFAVVFAMTTWLTFYTMIKSKRLSDFIDALSDERQTLRGRLKILARVWMPGSD